MITCIIIAKRNRNNTESIIIMETLNCAGRVLLAGKPLLEDIVGVLFSGEMPDISVGSVLNNTDMSSTDQLVRYKQ